MNSTYVLSCCSTADLSKEHFDRRNIHYVCFHYHLDGVDYPDDLGQTIPFPKFYDMLAKGSSSTTSQVNIDEYLAHFETFLSQGLDILHVCLSSGISGTYNSAQSAKLIAEERWPGRKVIVLDSLCASAGYGMLMDTLADKRDEGMSLQNLADWTEANKLRFNHLFFTTDLTFFVRGGRVSKAAGFFGGVLGICPLLDVNNEGKLIPREKLHGKKMVIRRIVKRMEELADGGRNYSGKCYLSNSACYDDAKAVVDLIKQTFPNVQEPEIYDIGTTIGSHTGPGTVALFFTGKERGDK